MAPFHFLMRHLSNRELTGWFFLAPVILIHMLVVAIPSISSLALCFTDWNGFGKINFVGFENFIELFDDRVFKKAIIHNLIWTALFLTIPIIFALMAAFLLTGIRRLQMFYRFVFFFPYILASIVNCLIWKYLLHPIHGLTSFFNSIGWESLATSPLTTKETSLYAVAFVDGWHFWGFLVVIYITAMYQVDEDLYEAADIEGASKWQKFKYVTFPSIRPMFFFSFLIIIIWSVPAFDYVYILTSGGPAYSSEVVANFMYFEAFRNMNVGYASAVGALMFIYVFFVLGFFWSLRKLGWEI